MASKGISYALTVLSTILIPSALSVPLAAREPCTKQFLASTADAYINSQRTGTLSSVSTTLASNFTYEENNVVKAISSSILTKSLIIDHHRINYDLVQCATYNEVISASDPKKPYVIGTQIHHTVDNTGAWKVAKIDSIVTTTNAWLFNATKTLEYVKKENWYPIPVEKRDKREVIQAAGDAYMSMWDSATAHTQVPWGRPCARLEGSAYTGKFQPDDSCEPGIPSNHSQAPNSRRRYVIDEEMGSVHIACVWEHMMNAADGHEFRLEGGKLRYVHTMTECAGRVCRL